MESHIIAALVEVPLSWAGCQVLNITKTFILTSCQLIIPLLLKSLCFYKLFGSCCTIRGWFQSWAIHIFEKCNQSAKPLTEKDIYSNTIFFCLKNGKKHQTQILLVESYELLMSGRGPAISKHLEKSVILWNFKRVPNAG